MAQGTTRGVPIDTDATLSANSDLLVPSQKAIKTYIGNNSVLFTSLSATSPLGYNNAGVFSISQSSASTNGYLSSTDFTTFNNKQNAISLTTTGISGSASLIGNTLNIPTYTLAGLGGQPQLNGTGFVKASGTTISYDNSTYLTTAITSLNGLTGATQTFANDTNVTMVSSGTSHTLTWSGTLSDSRITSASTWNGKGYGISFGSPTYSTVSGITLYYGNPAASVTTTAAIRRVYIPYSGTIKACVIYTRCSAASSNENWTMSIRLNNLTNTSVATVGNTSTDKVWTNYALNISVVAGDYFEITATNPTWTTTPGSVSFQGTIYIQ